jgi:hypothetical protein
MLKLIIDADADHQLLMLMLIVDADTDHCIDTDADH